MRVFVSLLCVIASNAMAQSALTTTRCRTLKDTKDRISACASAVRENERDVTARIDLANAFFDADSLAAAQKHFETAIRLDARYPGGHLGAGIVARKLGKLDEADRHLNRAVALAPNDFSVRFEYGVMLHLLNRPEAAFVEFATSARLRPDRVEAWGALGVLSAQMEKNRDAVAFWERAKLIDSSYFSARSTEATLFAKLRTATGAVPAADTLSLPLLNSRKRR